jgi:hypothetical protein
MAKKRARIAWVPQNRAPVEASAALSSSVCSLATAGCPVWVKSRHQGVIAALSALPSKADIPSSSFNVR